MNADGWAADEQLAALEVSVDGPAATAVQTHLADLVEQEVAAGIAGRDATLWGPDAEAEAAVRLAWVDLPRTSRHLVGAIEALRAELATEGVDRVVLCGMGGSSLAPEVLTRSAGLPLTVLDSTDPQQVRSVLEIDLRRTVVVVSSKSGSTVETDSQRRVLAAALETAGVDAGRRMVAVTDPGSQLEEIARDGGYRAVFLADPEVGGRYSALSAFGLVPAGLAGVDVGALLDEAVVVADLLADDAEGNPALVLGAALAGAPSDGAPVRDKVVLAEDGSGLLGLGDWAEQLIAESTGKQGRGLLPVVVEDVQAPEVRLHADDVLVVRLVDPDAVGPDGAAQSPDPAADESNRAEVRVGGRLGAQFLLWEYAIAVAGRLLGINPFDQPDVESAKVAARGMLEARPQPQPPAFTDGDVEVRGTPGLLDGVESLASAVAALLERLDAGTGYLAVMAYLDRWADAELAGVRGPLAERTGRPVTFGWGPRFLHSTGQYHKGGPDTGVYLQVTAEPGADLAVPDRPFTFGELIAAQAAGDADVLADKGRPVLRLHLRERDAGVRRLVELLGGAQ